MILHKIPFNKPYISEQELIYLQEAIVNNHLEGKESEMHKIIEIVISFLRKI